MIKHNIKIAIMLGVMLLLFRTVSFAQDASPVLDATVSIQAPAPASSPAVKSSKSPISLAITVRGGSSLGAYEAGFLYMITEFIKLNPDRFKLAAVTGSSAGSINSLLTAIAMGTKRQPDPTLSQYYKVWTGENLSFNKLFDTDAAPAGALSSRRSLHDMAEDVKKVWVADITEPLHLMVGVTATRRIPLQEQLISGLIITRQEEQFAFLVSNRANDRSKGPRIANHIVTLPGAPSPPLLPLVQSGPGAPGRQFDTFMNLLYASSAFPLAFPPQKVNFCLNSNPTPAATGPLSAICKKPNASADFIDGGLFDNSPQGLAVSMVKDNPRTHFLFVDPTNPNYLPEAEPMAPVVSPIEAFDESEYSFFKWLIQLDVSFISNAESAELHHLVTAHPDTLPRIHVTSRNFPDASGLMGNFLGFFEADFRKYDFYLGMYDADLFIKSTIQDIGGGRDLPPPSISGEGLAPYRCMRLLFDGDQRLKGSCKDGKLYNFHILVKAAVMRKGVAAKDRDKEDDMDLFMDFLEKQHFEFKDLGLSPKNADGAMLAMRTQLAIRLDSFNSKLKWTERIVLSTISKPALNFFYYASPEVIAYVVVGNALEVGLSNGLSPLNKFRLNSALSVKGLFTVGWDDPVVTFTAALGPQFELVGGATFQLRTSLRFGYQLSTYGGFSEETCDLTENSLRCSAPVAQFAITAVLLSRARLQLGLDWSPPWIPGVPPADDHLLSLMVAVGWQWLPGS